MNIVYHPVPAASNGTSSGSVPWSACDWKSAPTIPLSTAQLALAVLKDIDPAGRIPLLNVGALSNIFGAMYPSALIDQQSMLVAAPDFSGIPGNWKKLFSEMVAAATSLAIAEHAEGYPFCLSMQFCKEGAALSFPASSTGPWPAVYSAAIPTGWHVGSLSTSAIGELMPDYLLARQNSAGQFEFATLESKGRDAPVDSNHYPSFPKFQLQSRNAAIYGHPHHPSPPKISRHILSLVAVRTKASRDKTRVLRCRWTNHRDGQAAAGPVSDREGLRFATASYAVQLHNAGFFELADAIAGCLRTDRSRPSSSADRVNSLLRGDLSPPLFGLRGERDGTLRREVREVRAGDIVLPEETLVIIQKLCTALSNQDLARDRQLALDLLQHTQRSEARGRDRNFERRSAHTQISRMGLEIVTNVIED